MRPCRQIKQFKLFFCTGVEGPADIFQRASSVKDLDHKKIRFG